MIRPLLFPLIILLACTGNRYDQGVAVTGSDTGATSGTSGGTSSGTTPTGTTDDDDTTTAGPCSHTWHPIHATGWSKEFEVTYQGSEGIAYEEGLGTIGGKKGAEIYGYTDRIETGGNEYDVAISVGCDHDGEGMFVLDWAGDYNYEIFAGFGIPGTIEAALTPYRRYLPPEYAVGFSGNWDYDYDLEMLVVQEGKRPEEWNSKATGTFAEVGLVSISLLDGTDVEAYHLTNTYEMVGDIAMAGYIDQWWVNGLGLVRETNTADDGTVLISRDLTDYDGLTIITE